MKILTSSLLAMLFVSLSLFAQNGEMDKAAAEFYNQGNESILIYAQILCITSYY